MTGRATREGYLVPSTRPQGSDQLAYPKTDFQLETIRKAKSVCIPVEVPKIQKHLSTENHLSKTFYQNLLISDPAVYGLVMSPGTAQTLIETGAK